MGNKRRCAAIAAVLLLGLLLIGMIWDFPVLLGTDLPDTYADAIRSQAKGPYSEKLPLVPVFVRIEEFDGETAYYTIHYFPFGSVGMTYHKQDGYNIEKPLTGM